MCLLIDDIDEDLLLDDIVSIISRDTVMRSILVYANNIPRASKKIKDSEKSILS